MLLPLFCVCNICSVTAVDSHLVERFCCVNMCRLPENPIRYKTMEHENWQRILLDLTQIWIMLSVCFIYILTCCLKYLWINIYKKINCKTKMKCKDKSKECDFCAGTCTCTHTVTEL